MFNLQVPIYDALPTFAQTDHERPWKNSITVAGLPAKIHPKPQKYKERFLRRLEGDPEWRVGNDVERNILEILYQFLRVEISVRLEHLSRRTMEYDTCAKRTKVESLEGRATL